jgi:hypothetical protein
MSDTGGVFKRRPRRELPHFHTLRKLARMLRTAAVMLMAVRSMARATLSREIGRRQEPGLRRKVSMSWITTHAGVVIAFASRETTSRSTRAFFANYYQKPTASQGLKWRERPSNMSRLIVPLWEWVIKFNT